MLYLAVIHGDESEWETASAADIGATMEAYGAFAREAGEAGVLVDGHELDTTATATTVRVRDGETLVTDGPFAELKEAIGGYFLLECGSHDDACNWAAKIPAAANGAVEVRPAYVDDAVAS